MTIDPTLVRRLYASADAARWEVGEEHFGRALESSQGRAFEGRTAAPRERERYLTGLHLADLALACACTAGHEAAWDDFVREHRPILYRAADALDPSGGARELADALYADLYGVTGPDGARRSLFAYFHGRSSLATWLRAVLAQRHVDAVRARRRTEPLPDDERLRVPGAAADPDPDRPRLRLAMQEALAASVALLLPAERFRLRSYYLAGMTLAQIGRVTGEHEATVSRQLKRIRGALRQRVERHLREEARLDAAEIARAFEIAVEVDPDATLDLQQLLGSYADRKNEPADRST